MAIGDDLTGTRGGLIGPIDFTPALAEAGVRVAGSTPESEKLQLKRVGDQLVAQNGPTVTGIRQDQSRVQARGPQQLPTNQQRNPFDPRPQPLSANEIKDLEFTQQGEQLNERAGFLKKLGDIFTTENTAELLAELGIAIAQGGNARGQSIGTGIGESALRNVQNARADRLREQIASGVPPEEANVPGLDLETRARVLNEFNAADERERADEASERADRQVGVQEREATVSERRENRLGRQGDKELGLRERGLDIQAKTADALSNLRNAQARVTKEGGATEDTIAVAVNAIRQIDSINEVAGQMQERLTELNRRINEERGKSSFLGIGGADEGEIAAFEEERDNLAEQMRELQSQRTTLQERSNQILGVPIEVQSEEEAMNLPVGTKVILNGKRFTVREGG